jgi:ferredoxin
MPKIYYKTANKEIRVSGGEELVGIHNRDATLPIKFGCRQGNCGVCALRVLSGMANLSKAASTEIETLHRKGLNENKYRLACQCAINGDVSVEFL